MKLFRCQIDIISSFKQIEELLFERCIASIIPAVELLETVVVVELASSATVLVVVESTKRLRELFNLKSNHIFQTERLMKNIAKQ